MKGLRRRAGHSKTQNARRVDLANIHLEGARIVRVIEDADQHRLGFDMSHPIPEGGSDFPLSQLIFHHCTRYFVDEGLWQSEEPTIQRVEIIETGSHRMMIRLHTDHGVREVTCSTIVLEVSL
jgi:hypothetical protein